MNIDDIFPEIVQDFKSGASVEDKLSSINLNPLDLTEWVYSSGLFMDTSDFLLIIHRDVVFESIAEMDETETEISNKSDGDFAKHFESLTEDEFCISLHIEEKDGVFMHCQAESLGQGGFEFSNFGIALSRSEIIEEYENGGFFMMDGNKYHPKIEVIVLQMRSYLSN